ncbi:50S ribosomal protein L3 [Archaeoglobus fulgidus]|uniref:Large ribosomal subunit protein uL3 n=3 Tax=Archaeoglobus fulgidus TaxID=2234 RepID=RL3_ARCFU|nr:50S ribosomal protein L3 [Archaeoglobus fulgidus]O28354.1 RecName: Full=Large ribosomal subunit protein uL3; AltName: Full=50S ribosomal protein L3 [Archaeoglobus fulgidus DSM 4304]AAB89331.1 LSU ribosomal protein L3P (rpl3P) [Archaeoglobus fulgidus DSM 4304]AIG98920.1 archaeal ribosomal protein L3 [Archaeoglobus fulgidus DSM 8774]KUJ93924.1 MAG: 50S ribosomal protein L3 [Archaeoglobus fulgidus]KUK07449.1 MAG: 50S ribosomal protein L3 [Archaeoglobus fulgidus]
MKYHRPRRGSLAFSPRKRAKSIVPRIRAWPECDRVRMQGFAGYKAGMTHVVMIDDRKNSPTYGEEVVVPVTVIETPPMKVAAVRVYKKTQYGMQIAAEVWSNNLDDFLDRRLNLPKKEPDVEKLKAAVENGASEVRVVTYTQPYLITGVPKKVPDVMEHRIGGNVEEALDYAISKLGKEISVSEVFDEGAIIDVIAVTKGKGFQGPVKRWGVITLDAKHARSSKHRRVGNLGPWNPHHVRWTVPQAGQMGFHQRTEYNKRLIKIGENGEEITPKGGFLHYGVIRTQYVLVTGSVPGPVKRLIRMRDAIRPPKAHFDGVNIVYVSTTSKQGR